MKLFLRLLKEARQSQAVILLSIGLTLVAGLLSIYQARQISRLIDKVFLQGKSLPGVFGILLSVLIIIILRAVFVYGGELAASAGAQRIKRSLRKRLSTHILHLGPAFLRSEAGEQEVRTGEVVNTVMQGAESLELYFGQYLPQIALAVLIPSAILVFVFQSDLLSGIVMLVTAPLLPVFMYLIGSAAEALTRKQWRGLNRMSAYFLDVLQGLTTLKSLGRSRDQVSVISQVSEQYRQTTMGVLKVTFLSAMVLELIATLSTAMVAVEIGIRLLYGRLAFEQAFFVLLLAPEFYQPLRLLGTRFHAAMAGIEASKRIFAILDLPASNATPAIDSPIISLSKDHTPPSIQFQNVNYSYSNAHSALQGITIDIPAGKTTALMGESGAGKTTLTWLLLRFLQPKSGEILIDGKQLSRFPFDHWMDYLAWVSQNPFLFNDTIAANIKLSRPDASDTDFQTAVSLAHADGFISQLPQGYNTVVGERGMKLSAGQAQRIALARAFLKDAPLLILDEATSHLDPYTDALLQESLTHLCANRTVLIIAHHLSTLARADRVIWLSHGRVVNVQDSTGSAMPAQVIEKTSASQVNPLLQPESTRLRGESGFTEEHETPKQAAEVRLIELLLPFTGRIVLSILLGFATIASSIGLMTTAAYIISAAALHPSIADLSIAIVGVRFFGLSRGVFRYLERLVSHDVTFRLLARWRVWFYQALEPLAPARLMQYHSGDLLNRVISDIGTLEGFYVRTIAPPVVALLIGIAMSIFLGGFRTGLGWVFLAFLVTAGIGLPALVIKLSRQVGPQLIQARAQLSTLIVDSIQGMADLLTNSHRSAQITHLEQAGDQLSRLQSRMANISAMHTAASGFLANLCMLTVLAFATQSVSHSQLPGIFLGVVTLGALMSFEAFQPLPIVAQNMEANREAARRLYSLVDTQPAVSDPVEPVELPKDTQVAVHDLTFRYPAYVGEGQWPEVPGFCLSRISFSLPPGKHIAIVGPSGSGKTTLVNLLQRFWEYQQGSILWGGNELRSYRQDDLRKLISIISQATYLFSATIGENLRIARPEATEDEIIQAAKAAQLHELIQSLPEGYSTWIGEHGLHLSAGERQRLSIARALLKNAPLLILDEPTANLDPITELEVLNSIRELSQGRSTISITQHMVGLETMDDILVFQNGGIVEHGTHSELLSMQFIYFRMWELYNQII